MTSKDMMAFCIISKRNKGILNDFTSGTLQKLLKMPIHFGIIKLYFHQQYFNTIPAPKIVHFCP